MFDKNNLTICVSFYNTPHLVEPFLKSFIFHHPKVDKFKILISDNSTNEETQEILKKYNISSIRNFGMPHSPSIDLLFEQIKTKYALLCDSDILILKPLFDLFELLLKNDLTSMGEIQSDRGGYEFICPRVAPYWNLINLENIKNANIKFHDPERVKKSGSDGFFKNIPLQKNNGNKFYDVGTSFYEDIVKNGFKIGKINNKIVDYVHHFEGMSWRQFSKIEGYVKWGNEIQKQYIEESKRFQHIELNGKILKYE